MQLLYRINRAGTTVIVASHDNEMVDRMRRRVIELKRGRIVRDEASGLYGAREENTDELGERLARSHMKPGFFLKEAIRSMKRNAVPSFAALASVLVTMLVLGVFIPVVEATNGAANQVRGRVLVDVYLTTERQRRRRRARARRAAAGRRTSRRPVRLQAAGIRTGAEAQPEAFQLIGYNPLPDIFRITPDRPESSGALRAELDQASPLGIRLVTDPAIAAVQNRQAQTNRSSRPRA